jgi:hypothetical protein
MKQFLFCTLAGVALLLVGCQSQDPSVDKTPQVSESARPDTANLDKQRQMSTGSAGQAEVMK